jgi:hypothetical protein
VAEVYLQSRLDFLLNTQNQDGGWGYFPGKRSWMEPTTYAILALHGRPGSESPIDRAWGLIRSWQLPDGSHRPGVEVQDGTWVTAHAVTLACVFGTHDQGFHRSVDWLLRVSGSETRLAWRLASYLHLLATDLNPNHQGWPWRDGNSAWIEPTAHTLVALKKASVYVRTSKLRHRVRDGEAMVLNRRCHDGGWNCGSPNTFRYDLPSYPETTAVALLGLQGRPKSDIAGPLAMAQKFHSETKSSLARAWLSIALRLFNEPVPTRTDEAAPRDILLAALEALGHSNGNYRLFDTRAAA